MILRLMTVVAVVSMKLVHADLKPENLLFVNSEYKTQSLPPAFASPRLALSLASRTTSGAKSISLSNAYVRMVHF